MAARQRGYFTREEFLTVCDWRTTRSGHLVRSNPSAAIKAATRAALAAPDERSRMAALTRLRGVGVPTASALLFATEPDRYPIPDRRALQSLGRRPRGVYPVGFWLDYLETCRLLAAEQVVAQRTLDKALWQYSYEHSRRLRWRRRTCQHSPVQAETADG